MTTKVKCRKGFLPGKVSAILAIVMMAAFVVGGLPSSAAQSLAPSAPLTTSYKNDRAVVDISNKNEGYIMVKYTGDKSDARVQMLSPDSRNYSYSIPKGSFQVLPLSGGNGNYELTMYEHLDNKRYTSIMHVSVKAELRDSLLPFLYPSQYVNYSTAPKAVALSDTLTAGTTGEVEIVQNVYNHVITNITYDYPKADTIKFSYIPSLDETLSTGKGICFDYAALMAGMLRVQGIPTRMEFGYVSGGVYHAWLSVYLQDRGWVNGVIHFDGQKWKIMDPTFAAGGNSGYVGNGSDYSAVYYY